MLLRRSRRPAKFAGYTDLQGFKTADAPEPWPFGKTKKPLTTATPKGHAKHKAAGLPINDHRPPSLALTENRTADPWTGEDAPW